MWRAVAAGVGKLVVLRAIGAVAVAARLGGPRRAGGAPTVARRLLAGAEQRDAAVPAAKPAKHLAPRIDRLAPGHDELFFASVTGEALPSVPVPRFPVFL